MTLIQDQIERSQLFTTGHDKWEHYRRAALIDLDREGFASVHEAGLGTTKVYPESLSNGPEDRVKRFRAWTNESLIWTIDRIRENRNAEALRGFLQVVDYNARVNGTFHFYPVLHDAICALRNHFEKLLGK